MRDTVESRQNRAVTLADGPTNMARDGALLDAAERGETGWRVYGWDGVWISLGRFQRPERALVPGFERWCVRPTGGRAVLHGHDVTLAYALPYEDDGRSVKTLYRRLIEPLVAALNDCGLACDLAESTRYAGLGLASEDCFAFRSPNDVVCRETGGKVCGCALRVTHRAALLQASIPYEAPPSENAIVGGGLHPTHKWNSRGFEDAIRRALTSK